MDSGWSFCHILVQISKHGKQCTTQHRLCVCAHIHSGSSSDVFYVQVCSFTVSNAVPTCDCLHTLCNLYSWTKAQISGPHCSLAASAVVSQTAKSGVVKTISTVSVFVCVCVWDWWQRIEVRPSGQRDKSYSLILQKRWTGRPGKPSRPHLNCTPAEPRYCERLCACARSRRLCVDISFLTRAPPVFTRAPAAWTAAHLDNERAEIQSGDAFALKGGLNGIESEICGGSKKRRNMEAMEKVSAWL